MRPAGPALDAGIAAGEVLLCQQGRHQSVLGGAPRVEALRHRAEHLAQSDGLRRRQSEGPAHLLFGQPEQPAARGGRAEDAGRAGDVPAPVVVRRVDRVADAALHFGAEHERMQEVAARDRLSLRQRQNGRRDRARRVDDRLQVRIVEIQHV